MSYAGQAPQSWMERNRLRALEEGDYDTAQGAEEQALILGFWNEEAEIHGRPILGLALDGRKAYDRFSLQGLKELLAHIGLPGTLTGPLLSMYTADRIIAVDGVAVKPRTPVSGIVAGCPLAAFVMEIAQWAIYNGVRLDHEGVVRRRWVDVTTHRCYEDAGGIAAVLEADQATCAGARAFGLDPNEDKTCRFATNAAATARLGKAQGAINFPVKKVFKDLGEAQGQARELKAISNKRWTAFEERLLRIH